MSLEKRNKIVPQMIDYDQIGDQWVPYVMRFDRPLRKFPSVSTDENGFRHTTSKDGQSIVSFVEFNKTGNVPHSAIVGSSACFGVGATKNVHTIASYMNKITDSIWFNYGGRALNSTQEVILFLLFLPNKLDKLVIFSGVNNLTLSYLSSESSPYYNSFFFQSVFEKAMDAPGDDIISVRKSFSQLMLGLKQKLLLPDRKPARKNIDLQYDNILSCFKRDLDIINSLGKARGFEVYFALQPVATWIDKHLSVEEKQIFSILDALSMDWIVLSKYISAQREQYKKDVQVICEEIGVPFINLNSYDDFTEKDWLFVDRVHLTDSGYQLCSEIMKREFKL